MDYVTSRAPAARNDRNAWAEPGVEDLGGGLYRIPLPLPGDALTAVNVYALTGDDGVDLIDAGMALVQARERSSSSAASWSANAPPRASTSTPSRPPRPASRSPRPRGKGSRRLTRS